MAQTKQTFGNDKDGPIYVSIEPWPECFELEPGDRLTLIWETPDAGDVMETYFINDNELVVWPNVGEVQYLINDEPAQDRSWKFKHQS